MSDTTTDDDDATSLAADVHFGGVDKPLPNWRENEAVVNDEDPDDEEIDTPDDVVAVLGFDPRDLDDEE